MMQIVIVLLQLSVLRLDFIWIHRFSTYQYFFLTKTDFIYTRTRPISFQSLEKKCLYLLTVIWTDIIGMNYGLIQEKREHFPLLF
jgi:hypothetical protein